MVSFSGFGGGFDLGGLDLGGDLVSNEFQIETQPHVALDDRSEFYNFNTEPPPLDPSKVEFRLLGPSIFDRPNTTFPLPIDYGLPNPEIQPWQRLTLPETMDHIDSDWSPSRSGLEQFLNPGNDPWGGFRSFNVLPDVTDDRSSTGPGQLVAQNYQPPDLGTPRPGTTTNGPAYHSVPIVNQPSRYVPLDNGGPERDGRPGGTSQPGTPGYNEGSTLNTNKLPQRPPNTDHRDYRPTFMPR